MVFPVIRLALISLWFEAADPCSGARADSAQLEGLQLLTSLTSMSSYNQG